MLRIGLIALPLIFGYAAMMPVSNPQPPDASTSGGLLLVANKAAQSMSIIEPESGSTVATVPEGGTTGHELIASPDGKLAYVPMFSPERTAATW